MSKFILLPSIILLFVIFTLHNNNSSEEERRRQKKKQSNKKEDETIELKSIENSCSVVLVGGHGGRREYIFVAERMEEEWVGWDVVMLR